MPSQRPPPESKPEVGDKEVPEGAMDRFNRIANGLLTVPREPVMEAERAFKEREKRRP